MSSKPHFKFRAPLTHLQVSHHLAALVRFLFLLQLEVLEPSERLPAPDWKTDGWTAPPHPSPDTITNSPVKSTYIYELFINLLTLIYDPWLDLTLDSLGVFLSFCLSLWDFFLSVNVTVHNLNIATRLKLGGRQLGAQPMSHGQEPGRDLCPGLGLGQKAAAGWFRGQPGSRRRSLGSRDVGRSRKGTNWI